MDVLRRLLALVNSLDCVQELGAQLVEVALRVEPVRPFAVECALDVVLDAAFIAGPKKDIMVPAFEACVWVLGEYFNVVMDIAKDTIVARDDSVDDDDDDDDEGYWIEGPDGEEFLSKWRDSSVHIQAAESLLNVRTLMLLPPTSLRVVVHALQKIFFSCAAHSTDPTMLAPLVCLYRQSLSLFFLETDMEVQERVHTLWSILNGVGILEPTAQAARGAAEARVRDGGVRGGIGTDGDEITVEVTEDDVRRADVAFTRRAFFGDLISEPFYAVHAKAQRRVPRATPRRSRQWK
jgi:hypothetical protein